MTEGNVGSMQESMARRGGWAEEAGIEQMEPEIVNVQKQMGTGRKA